MSENESRYLHYRNGTLCCVAAAACYLSITICISDIRDPEDMMERAVYASSCTQKFMSVGTAKCYCPCSTVNSYCNLPFGVDSVQFVEKSQVTLQSHVMAWVTRWLHSSAAAGDRPTLAVL